MSMPPSSVIGPLMAAIEAVAESHGMKIPTVVLFDIAKEVLGIVQPQPEPAVKEYISRKDLAAELGKQEMSLIRWEKEGRGPPVTRIGRDVVYSRSGIEAWLKSLETSR